MLLNHLLRMCVQFFLRGALLGIEAVLPPCEIHIFVAGGYKRLTKTRFVSLSLPESDCRRSDIISTETSSTSLYGDTDRSDRVVVGPQFPDNCTENFACGYEPIISRDGLQ